MPENYFDEKRSMVPVSPECFLSTSQLKKHWRARQSWILSSFDSLSAQRDEYDSYIGKGTFLLGKRSHQGEGELNSVHLHPFTKNSSHFRSESKRSLSPS